MCGLAGIRNYCDAPAVPRRLQISEALRTPMAQMLRAYGEIRGPAYMLFSGRQEHNDSLKKRNSVVKKKD